MSDKPESARQAARRRAAFIDRAVPALRQARRYLAAEKGEHGAGLLLYEIDAALSLLDRAEQPDVDDRSTP